MGSSTSKLQFEIYHRQIIHGDILTGLRQMMPVIEHVQIESVPLRDEPGMGELDDFCVLRELESSGLHGRRPLRIPSGRQYGRGARWLERLRSGYSLD